MSAARSPRPRKAPRKFGGTTITFAGVHETAEQVFGPEPVAPSTMLIKLWALIRAKDLLRRGDAR